MDIKHNERLSRGNKLWEMKFVLPEHKQELTDWKKEQEKVPCPQLDEQARIEIERLLLHSLYHHSSIELVYWHNGYLHKMKTVIMQLNYEKKLLTCKDGEGVISIRMKYLKDVSSVTD
ncbi:YolD-like family protein [Bacillus sp. JCM 19034]|uniref:YolD-like family protein n=1 Tax=Bacillus sp. JCM 19034 TaxID=1481928 RepID=UPI0007823FFB|nr:YolD-like family protein [Bacillus sp. JCM 19034]